MSDFYQTGIVAKGRSCWMAYPLAGEFCIKADLARVNRIPADWGLEIGVLAEILRTCSPKRVCQAELCGTYEHKHQALSASDPTEGLMKMAVDICKTFFRSPSTEGAVLNAGAFRTLLPTYIRIAEDTTARYHADALIDGLHFDRHDEEAAVEDFARALRIASEAYLEDPLRQPLIPNWNRITAVIPEFLAELRAAVEADNA